jgi:hypothetical protein
LGGQLLADERVDVDTGAGGDQASQGNAIPTAMTILGKSRRAFIASSQARLVNFVTDGTKYSGEMSGFRGFLTTYRKYAVTKITPTKRVVIDAKNTRRRQYFK